MNSYIIESLNNMLNAQCLFVLIRNNCDTIRPHLRQTLLRDSKMAQLLQIEDNRKIRQSEKDNEKMWYHVQQKVYQQMVVHIFNYLHQTLNLC